MAKDGEKWLRGSFRRHLMRNLGVQSWLREAARRAAASLARDLAERMSGAADVSNPSPGRTPPGPMPSAFQAPDALLSTPEDLRNCIELLRTSLIKLDDVDYYETLGAVDEDMYRLWKELERKMQMHRQSEAKYQLQEMFRI